MIYWVFTVAYAASALFGLIALRMPSRESAIFGALGGLAASLFALAAGQPA